MHTLCHPLHSGSLFPLFWLPLLPCCAPPPCLLCSPLSLLVWLPRSVCMCCSSPCLVALLGAPVAHSLLSHPPAPPPVRGFHISVRRGLSRAWLASHGPVATPVAGTSRRAGRSPRPCGVRGHLVEGGEGGGGVADGSLGVRRMWWLMQCSHLMVSLCILVCPAGARLTAVCGAALCPVALLLAFLPISGSFFFCWHAHGCWCAAPGGQHVAPCSPVWLSGCPTCSWVVPGAPGTFAHVSKSANSPVTGVFWGCSGVNVVHCCSCALC